MTDRKIFSMLFFIILAVVSKNSTASNSEVIEPPSYFTFLFLANNYDSVSQYNYGWKKIGDSPSHIYPFIDKQQLSEICSDLNTIKYPGADTWRSADLTDITFSWSHKPQPVGLSSLADEDYVLMNAGVEKVFNIRSNGTQMLITEKANENKGIALCFGIKSSENTNS
ncbi:hypothetical protein [Dongshaea marina]|uniref:hypothetical protein n=1 Tax=Dongshaea marina TaxID=2047966 RepID=UPI000D3EAF49|nr:hypothetical protein [Dongshaea marina]